MTRFTPDRRPPRHERKCRITPSDYADGRLNVTNGIELHTVFDMLGDDFAGRTSGRPPRRPATTPPATRSCRAATRGLSTTTKAARCCSPTGKPTPLSSPRQPARSPASGSTTRSATPTRAPATAPTPQPRTRSGTAAANKTRTTRPTSTAHATTAPTPRPGPRRTPRARRATHRPVDRHRPAHQQPLYVRQRRSGQRRGPERPRPDTSAQIRERATDYCETNFERCYGEQIDEGVKNVDEVLDFLEDDDVGQAIFGLIDRATRAILRRPTALVDTRRRLRNRRKTCSLCAPADRALESRPDSPPWSDPPHRACDGSYR